MTSKKNFLAILAFCTALFGAACASAGDYLVYDPGGSQSHIQDSMTALGYSFDVASAANPVTAAMLSSHKALIIGWTVGGNWSGLDQSVLAAGITGNRILTGHDADYHTWAGVAAAETLMDRYVLFAGASPGATGLVAFPDWANPAFSWLPSAWGVASTGNLTSETVTSITADGQASGFYAGLTTADLSNWVQSYHAYFTGYNNSLFNAFEIGSEGYAVTLGYTVTPVVIGVPEPEIYAMLGVGLGLMGWVGRRRKLQAA